MRIGTRWCSAATRKCPDPQHGSSTLSSAAVFGQPSNVPAAGRHGPPSPSAPRTKRRYSQPTPGRASLRAQFVFGLGAGGVLGGELLARPPRAQRVVEQELHHVRLGEELRHRGDFVRPDLHLGAVDLILLLALPELVDPPQRVGRGEDRRRQRRQQLLQLEHVLGGEGDLEQRVVRPEDLRQHPLGAAGGEDPHVHAFFLGQFLGLGQADGHVLFRLDQQIVLGQEPGKEHPMPVLVGALADQVVDGQPAGRVLPVPELPRPGAEMVAQFALGRLHVRVRLVVVDRQGFQGGASADLGRVAGLDDHALQFVP